MRRRRPGKTRLQKSRAKKKSHPPVGAVKEGRRSGVVKIVQASSSQPFGLASSDFGGPDVGVGVSQAVSLEISKVEIESALVASVVRENRQQGFLVTNRAPSGQVVTPG